MTIRANDQTKVRIAISGPNKLFGISFEDRKKMPTEDLVKLFDRVWREFLEREIIEATQWAARDAYERLLPSNQAFFDFQQSHFAFRPKNMNLEMIAQLNETSAGEWELTQLWKVASSDTHPETLYVTFESVEERERFRRLANALGQHDETLGLELIRDFMQKHPERFFKEP